VYATSGLHNTESLSPWTSPTDNKSGADRRRFLVFADRLPFARRKSAPRKGHFTVAANCRVLRCGTSAPALCCRLPNLQQRCLRSTHLASSLSAPGTCLRRTPYAPPLNLPQGGCRLNSQVRTLCQLISLLAWTLRALSFARIRPDKLFRARPIFRASRDDPILSERVAPFHRLARAERERKQ
jgi:hypothetical protein